MGRVTGRRRPLQDVEEAPMREFDKEMLVMIAALLGLYIGLLVAIALVMGVLEMIVNG